MSKVIFDGPIPGYGGKIFRIVVNQYGGVYVETKGYNALGEEYWKTLQAEEVHEITDWELAVLKYYILKHS